MAKQTTPGTLVGVGFLVKPEFDGRITGGRGGSRSTKGWRLKPTDKLVTPMHGKSGVTSGAIDPALGLGRARKTAAKPVLTKSQQRRAAKRAARTITGR